MDLVPLQYFQELLWWRVRYVSLNMEAQKMEGQEYKYLTGKYAFQNAVVTYFTREVRNYSTVKFHG